MERKRDEVLRIKDLGKERKKERRGLHAQNKSFLRKNRTKKRNSSGRTKKGRQMRFGVNR